MDLNSKYQIPIRVANSVLRLLHEAYLSRIPTKQVDSLVIVEEFYLRDEELAFQRIYDVSQLEKGRLVGKPKRICLSRNDNSRLEFGFTNLIEIRKMLEFVGYRQVGLLTQMRTSFVLADELIEIPIAVCETNELGVFLEVGSATGPVSNLQTLLQTLQETIGIQNEWLQTTTYPDLLHSRTNGNPT